MKIVLLIMFGASFALQVFRPDLQTHGAVIGFVTNVIWLLS